MTKPSSTQNHQVRGVLKRAHLVVELAPIVLHLVEEAGLAANVVVDPQCVELLHDVLGGLVPVTQPVRRQTGRK